MQKNSKNHENRKNYFFLETTKNTLVYVSNTIWDVLDKFQVKISQKRTWSFSQKSLTADMQKIQKTMKIEKILFSSKQLKIP